MTYTRRSDPELLRAALVGYRHQYEVLGERIAEIKRELGGRPVSGGGADQKRVFSSEIRRRMALGGNEGIWNASQKKKRKMSAEGRERIAEATENAGKPAKAAKNR
jgi:hypothetical protein